MRRTAAASLLTGFSLTLAGGKSAPTPLTDADRRRGDGLRFGVLDRYRRRRHGDDDGP